MQTQNLKINNLKFIESFEKILNKDSEVIPFKPNKGQMRLYNAIKEMKQEKKPVRIVILKARQIGFSTMTGGVFFADTITHANKKTVIVAHEDDATNSLFNMYKRFNKYLPEELKHEERANNAKAIIWDSKEGIGLESSISCKTASNEGLGASQTINNLHLSEYGLWRSADPKMAFTSIMQCVPNRPNSMVIVESTARGYNHFYDLCQMAMKGEGGWKFLFVAWWENEEYQMPYTGFTLTPQEESIKAKYNLTNDQLEWRRWCIATNCLGDLNKFNQEYPACPEDAFVSSGESVFDKEILAFRRSIIAKQNIRPTRVFDFEYTSYDDSLFIENITQKNSDKGFIKIFEEPQPRTPYVIGCDTSGAGIDYSVAQVINNLNGRQVAIMRCQLGERRFIEQLYCLGQFYNMALIAVETNFSTYPMEILSRMEYPNLYRQRSIDSISERLKNSFGFRTTPRTRPVAIAMLKEEFEARNDIISDLTTLSEMETFVRDENGKPQAMKGKHDDCVMAICIAYYCADQQEVTLLDEEEKEEWKLPIEFRSEEEDRDKGEFISWD